jgi:hypothetical protein
MTSEVTKIVQSGNAGQQQLSSSHTEVNEVSQIQHADSTSNTAPDNTTQSQNTVKSGLPQEVQVRILYYI